MFDRVKNKYSVPTALAAIRKIIFHITIGRRIQILYNLCAYTKCTELLIIFTE